MTTSVRPQPSLASTRGSSYSGSEGLSSHTLSTTATMYSPRPSLQHSEEPGRSLERWEVGREASALDEKDDPRSSVETYASTVPSEEDYEHDLQPFEVSGDDTVIEAPTALAATPQEFASFFPSTKQIAIKHDDTTLDGNMNLRLDTTAFTSDNETVDLTLFHLRMHDLKRREFSLRRYCRESGREVCHSSRKTQPTPRRSRPGFQRSMSNALSSLRSKSDVGTPTKAGLTKQDSGYASISGDVDPDKVLAPSVKSQGEAAVREDVMNLEFSNYAHLEIRRRGTKSTKRYDFEYWGTKYAWRRISKISGDFNEVSYHLVNSTSSASVAHIVPVPMSLSEVREEEAKGGWIPPCSMWISDERLLDQPLDVSDVIVATGLMALVDDTIRNRWHKKSHVQLSLPILTKSAAKNGAEALSPKRIFDEVFNRRPHPTPLRQLTA